METEHGIGLSDLNAPTPLPEIDRVPKLAMKIAELAAENASLREALASLIEAAEELAETSFWDPNVIVNAKQALGASDDS